MSIRLGVIGAKGRMGKQVIDCALQNANFSLDLALTSEKHTYDHPHIETPVKLFPSAARCLEENIKLPKVDVFIDFSTQKALIDNLRLAQLYKTPIVIGTTGISEKEYEEITKAAKEIPVFWAPNFSIGIAASIHTAKHLSKILKDFTTSITETHHIHKKDAPSGSAISIQKALAQEGVQAAITSIREGEILGKHTLVFTGKHETLTLTHEALSREAFAEGSLNAAKFLMDKAPGLYQMDDLLNLAIQTS